MTQLVPYAPGLLELVYSALNAFYSGRIARQPGPVISEIARRQSRCLGVMLRTGDWPVAARWQQRVARHAPGQGLRILCVGDRIPIALATTG